MTRNLTGLWPISLRKDQNTGGRPGRAPPARHRRFRAAWRPATVPNLRQPSGPAHPARRSDGDTSWPPASVCTVGLSQSCGACMAAAGGRKNGPQFPLACRPNVSHAWGATRDLSWTQASRGRPGESRGGRARRGLPKGGLRRQAGYQGERHCPRAAACSLAGPGGLPRTGWGRPRPHGPVLRPTGDGPLHPASAPLALACPDPTLPAVAFQGEKVRRGGKCKRGNVGM